MSRKYYLLIALIAAVLFAACPLEGGVSFGDGEEYTITYSANGGTGSAPASHTVKSGSRISLPNADGLSKAGSVFGGWCESAAGTGTKFAAGSSFTMPNNDVTLYAYWDGSANTNTYTVTFNANGGTGTPPAAQTVTAGTSITLPNGGGLTRSNYTFGGWSISTGGTGNTYSAGASYSVNSNVTLYAKWNSAAKTFTVRFEANGGTGTPPPTQTVAAGTVITMPQRGNMLRGTDPFRWWSTNPSGGREGYICMPGDSYTVTADVTFYAIWQTGGYRTIRIAFHPNGGLLYDLATGKIIDNHGRAQNRTGIIGSNMTLPGTDVFLEGTELYKSGYDFAGWSTNAEGTGVTYPAGASFLVTGTVTSLYAKWSSKGETYPAGGPGGTAVPPSSVSGAW